MRAVTLQQIDPALILPARHPARSVRCLVAVSRVGRIGRGGHVRIEPHRTRREAEQAIADMRRRKERRGYR